MILFSPNKIYKSLSCKKDAENLNKGNLLLRSIEYYKSYPKDWEYSEKISDGDESILRLENSISIQGSLHSQARLIFSSHEIAPANKPHIIEINNPSLLFKEITNRIENALCFSKADWTHCLGKVLYYNRSKDKDAIMKEFRIINPLFADADQDHDFINYGFLKSKDFECQNEIRMWFLVNPEKLSTNKLCKFVERSFCSSRNKYVDFPIDFESWVKKKKKSKQYFNNYWIQIDLKINPNFFNYYNENL